MDSDKGSEFRERGSIFKQMAEMKKKVCENIGKFEFFFLYKEAKLTRWKNLANIMG